jgi:CII-binding regulator of phage lambda lysogenization HflD
MFKKIIFIAICWVILLALPAIASANSAITLVINGTTYVDPQSKVAPYLNQEKKLMVPLRAILVSFPGADSRSLKWDAAKKEISLTVLDAKGKPQYRLSHKAGSDIFFINGLPISMDSVSEIRNNSLYMPLRDVVETVGAKVHWDGKKQTVYVTVTNLF